MAESGGKRSLVHIFGASGSGTSTLARAFCQRTGYRFLDSDDFLWLPTDPPFTAKRSPAERLALLERELDRSDAAVLSGSLVGWGDPLVPRFTLAVRLTAPTEVRLERLRKREAARYGDRILPGGDMIEIHLAFLRWAAGYDEGDPSMRSRAQHDLWQRKLSCPLLTLDGTLPVPALLETLLAALEAGARPQ